MDTGAYLISPPLSLLKMCKPFNPKFWPYGDNLNISIKMHSSFLVTDVCADKDDVECSVALNDPMYYCNNIQYADYTRERCPETCDLCGKYPLT